MIGCKYKSELEFCREVCQVIAGLLVDTKREETIFIPEVPHGYFSNEHVDMMLLDVKNLEYLLVEFKLRDIKALERQIAKRDSNVVGIINSVAKGDSHTYYNIFNYTGRDAEIEKMGSRVCGIFYPRRWFSIYRGFGMIYYWAYKHNKSSFDGGLASGNRQMFAGVYKKAIRNLHKHYGSLDFMLTHAALNSGYSIDVSKKYYRQALVAELKEQLP